MKARILLVNEEVAERRRLREALGAAGYPVEEVSGGLSALERLGAAEEQPFGAVILSPGLEDIPSNSLAEVIKSHLPELELICLCGYCEEVDLCLHNSNPDPILKHLQKLHLPEQEAAPIRAWLFIKAGEPLRAREALLKEFEHVLPVRDPQTNLLLPLEFKGEEHFRAELKRLNNLYGEVRPLRLGKPLLSPSQSAFLESFLKQHPRSRRDPTQSAHLLVMDCEEEASGDLYARLAFHPQLKQLVISEDQRRLCALFQGDKATLNFENLALADGVDRLRSLQVISDF